MPDRMFFAQVCGPSDSARAPFYRTIYAAMIPTVGPDAEELSGIVQEAIGLFISQVTRSAATLPCLVLAFTDTLAVLSEDMNSCANYDHDCERSELDPYDGITLVAHCRPEHNQGEIEQEVLVVCLNNSWAEGERMLQNPDVRDAWRQTVREAREREQDRRRSR